MHGCNGKMGQVISKLVEEDNGSEIVAGIDICDTIENSYPVFTNIDECDVAADVVIDFSSAKAIDKLLEFCKKRNLPLVLCSTGLSEEQIYAAHNLSKEIPVLRSGNMSLGINTVMKVLSNITKLLSDAGYDIEIIEKHHNQKVDAPSGTALMLADTINEQLNCEYKYVYDRSNIHEKRSKKEIGISSVRGGTIVGDHDVILQVLMKLSRLHIEHILKEYLVKGPLKQPNFLQNSRQVSTI